MGDTVKPCIGVEIHKILCAKAEADTLKAMTDRRGVMARIFGPARKREVKHG